MMYFLQIHLINGTLSEMLLKKEGKRHAKILVFDFFFGILDS